MRGEVLHAIGLALAALELWRVYIQVRHIFKEDSTSGLNPLVWCGWMFSWFIWSLYAAAIGDVAIMVLGCGAGVLMLPVTIRMIRLKQLKRGGIVLVAALHAPLFYLVLVSPLVGILALSVCDTLWLIPQLRTVLRSEDLGGISKRSVQTSLVQCVMWCAYAGAIGYPEAAAPTVFVIVYDVVSLYRLHSVRADKKHHSEESELPGACLAGCGCGL